MLTSLLFLPLYRASIRFYYVHVVHVPVTVTRSLLVSFYSLIREFHDEFSQLVRQWSTCRCCCTWHQGIVEECPSFNGLAQTAAPNTFICY